MFDVLSGRLLRTLGGGHFDTINCCRYVHAGCRPPRWGGRLPAVAGVAEGTSRSKAALWRAIACRTPNHHPCHCCCCRWNAAAEELYSGSSDSNIVVWSPAREAVTAERDGWQGRDSDGDDWSD